MFTREDYIENRCTHRQYYGQFVKARHKRLVVRCFGLGQLKEAFVKDANLNSISLGYWDRLTTLFLTSDFELNSALKNAGDYSTLAGWVCILKEAARQAIEESKHDT